MKQILYFISLFLLLGVANTNAQVAGDDCQNARQVTSLPYTHSDNTSNYNNGHNSTTCYNTMYRKDVVYSYTPSTNEVVNVNLTGISRYTYLQVLTGCPFTTCIQNEQLGSTGNSLSIEELSLTGGTTYYFLIERNEYPYTTAYTLNINKVSCAEPSDLALSNITSTSAQLDWTENAGATTWDLWYVKDGETIGAAPNYNDVTTKPYTFNGLTPNTKYKLYVRSVCGTNGGSEIAESAEFITPCMAVTTYPFTEEFEGITSGQPDCWRIAGTTTIASSHWNSYNEGNSGRGMRFNSYYNNPGNTSELTTPTLDLSSLTNPELKFDFKNPAGGNFEVLISSNGGTSYTSLANNLTGQTAWTEKTYDITAHTSSNVIIKFKGTSNYGNGDAYIYLDGVEVRTHCPATTGIDVQTTCGPFTWIDGNVYTSSNNTATHTLTNAAGCDSVVTLNLTSLVDNSVQVNNNTITANESNADTYTWIDCDNNNTIIEGETSASYTPTETGNYAVIIVKNNCIDTSACSNITVTNVNDLITNELKIYPNPTTGIITIETKSNSDINLKVLTYNGKEVYRETLTLSKEKVDLRELPKGLYFVIIEMKENTIMQKITIE